MQRFIVIFISQYQLKATQDRCLSKPSRNISEFPARKKKLFKRKMREQKIFFPPQYVPSYADFRLILINAMWG